MNKTKLYSNDFNMCYTDDNGQFIRIEELNNMIECGAIMVDEEKLDRYKFETCYEYNKEVWTEEEAFEMYRTCYR